MTDPIISESILYAGLDGLQYIDEKTKSNHRLQRSRLRSNA